MSIELATTGRHAGWVRLGTTSIYFETGVPWCFISVLGAFKRESYQATAAIYEELEEAVFDFRLEEAIVDGLTGEPE